ncbi:camp-dependent protein kinase catalytic subunit [Meira miltonrushii]|uniref:cAMP-dependent protein kinase n=1 Tax=Meira miltonrushii TaxID=1280837 RepID=A0A316VFN9_9BASI|nr:camp-dependent protein kinase catalytic subunit [Meira miltonrushii]PWN36134.1 camp-dependent protein kinase catalytic subunit [Meira miltonrushii]
MQGEQRQYSSIFQAQPLHSLSQYEPLETLGTGTFGRVLLVRLRSGSKSDPKNYYALKVLNKLDVIRLKQITHTNNERDILSKVHHPFIVDLHCTYQDEKNCYMLMEYVVGGEVFSHLRKARRFTVDVTRFYISCLILALAHLHSEKILYRDLKPENLLLDRQGYIKITDFGFAKSLHKTGRTWTLCGTPEYLSPEVIQSQGQSFASDYWALGILMYEMLCGFPPFYDKTPFGTYEKILQANIVFPKHVDACSRDLIQSFLKRDVTKRLGNLSGGVNDVIRHPWFEGVDWQALLAKRIPAPIIPVQSHAGDCANFQKYDAFDIAKMPALQQQQQNTKSRRTSSSEDYIQSQFRDF